MRLHSLSATAFGPFVDTVTVDFDALSSAGLFLLTGATGAGKTSVLDAVCFALYGDVPGDRSVAKRLRSDQAAPDVAPEVTLEATLAGRRFRLVRSPAWQRPKKRGTGTTPQQATVTMTELVGDDWTLLSSRLDETGDLVTGLLGMNLPQFCQVAMLPQGKFQAFLRARADERQSVLQQLFHTSRFARVEAWLRDHRLELSRSSRRLHDTVLAHVNRVSECAGSPPPESWDLQALEVPAADGTLGLWASELHQAVEDRLAEAALRLPGALDAEDAARLRLEESTRTAELRARHQAAARAHALLMAEEASHQIRVREIDSARRAAAVVTLVRIAEQAEWETSAARVRCTAGWDALAEGSRQPWATTTLETAGWSARLDAPSDSSRAADQTQELRAVLQSALAALGELRGSDVGLRALQQAVAESCEELANARARAETLARESQTLPVRITELRTLLEASRQLAESTGAREAEVGALATRLAAHAQAESLTVELAEAEQARAECRAEALQATEVWLDLRETRLAGMAAEIAGALAVGGSCPVCGSCSHPQPASPSPGAPDADAERSALRAVDDAKATLLAHDEVVHQLKTRLEVARASVGGEDATTLAQRHTDSLSALRTGREAQRRCVGFVAELDELEEALARSQALRQESERGLSRLDERQQQCARDHDALVAQRDAVLAGTDLDSVTTLLERLQGLDQLAARFLDLQARADEAAQRAQGLAVTLATSLDDHGFAHAEAALAAHRDDAALDALRELVARHQQEESRCLVLLSDPELQEAAASPSVDLVALTERHHELREATHRLRSDLEAARSRSTRLAGLTSELQEALTAWQPLRERHQVAADLSAFVEGKSVDNRQQMRLSAYVLGYRLSQVVDAANLRLAGMSGQRYSLEHTGRRGNRETRGGLGLLVRDDWSGEARDPATLSGGETFVVSLALALGLADVIADEAGGADLDTLFVDEGFGSLDADTLDDVLDVLDALRDGGRVVGVVSHVTEMRERIPTQLRIIKGRQGSTLEVTA